MKTGQNQSVPLRVGVVGARGYSGQELCRLLTCHSKVTLEAIFFNEGKSFSLWNQFPEMERLAKSYGKTEPRGIDLDVFFNSQNPELDVVFLATPNEVSMVLAGQFFQKGISVIDLSGAFRLNKSDVESCAALYLKYYSLEHTQTALLQKSVYGLHPFSSLTVAAQTSSLPTLVANPGCYVTSVLMGLIPLLKAGLIDESSIVIDAKSGASGAGKKLNENLLFSELYSDFYPYKVLNHQHTPEMEMYLDHFSGKKARVVFTPHLLPVFRGLLSTCYLKWSDEFKKGSIEEKKSLVSAAYTSAYQNYHLVEWGDFKTMQKKMSLKAVIQSCATHIAFELDADNLIVCSALDNLLKGAASQAVENLNCIYGFKIFEGLV